MSTNKLISSFRNDQLVFLIISILSLVYVVFRGPIIYPDSPTYVDMHIIRSFGYPLFTSIIKIFFGGYYLNAIIVVQFFLLQFSIFQLIRYLNLTLTINNKWFLLLIYISLLLPVFYEINVSNAILSEGIAYPLYLLIIRNLLIVVTLRSYKYFYYGLILTFFLISIRSQFIFLIPTFFIVILLVEQKLFLKKNIKPITALFSISFLIILTDIQYHKIVHKQVTTTPWTGIQIAALPFYVSDESDYLIFKNKLKQDYFKLIYSKLKSKKKLLNQVPSNINKNDFFYNNYDAISIQTINKEGELFFDSKLNTNQKTVLNNSYAIAMVMPLIRNNFKKWGVLYIKNCTRNIDFQLSLFILFMGALMVMKKNSVIGTIVLLFSLLIVENILIVGFAETTLKRYIFYNNWIFIALFCYLFEKAMKNKNTITF